MLVTDAIQHNVTVNHLGDTVTCNVVSREGNCFSFSFFFFIFLQKKVWILLTVTFTPQILHLYAKCSLKLAKIKQIDPCDKQFFLCSLISIFLVRR